MFCFIQRVSGKLLAAGEVGIDFAPVLSNDINYPIRGGADSGKREQNQIPQPFEERFFEKSPRGCSFSHCAGLLRELTDINIQA